MNTNNNLKEAYKEQKIKEFADELSEVIDASEDVRRHLAATLIEREYRKERHGAWIKDESYQNKTKEIYYCTCCNHWQSTKKRNQIQFMNYCPLCGARMDKPEVKE